MLRVNGVHMRQEADIIKALGNVFGDQTLKVLELHNQETSEFNQTLALANSFKSLVRLLSDITPDIVARFIAELQSFLPATNQTLVTNKLNKKFWTMEGDNLAEFDVKNLRDKFPQGQPEKWPVIAFTSNSNLASAISFVSNLDNAKQIGGKDCIVIGAYNSKRNMILNSTDTLHRFVDLKSHKGEYTDNVSPASVKMAEVFADIITDKKKLRPDAREIMGKVVGYGYSGAALTNHDAIRVLKSWISGGAFKVEDGGKLRKSNQEDAIRIISQVKLFALGGADLSRTGEFAGPKCQYFVSKNDASIAMLGSSVFRDKSAIEVKTDPQRFAGHSEEDYMQAAMQQIKGKGHESANIR